MVWHSQVTSLAAYFRAPSKMIVAPRASVFVCGKEGDLSPEALAKGGAGHPEDGRWSLTPPGTK